MDPYGSPLRSPIVVPKSHSFLHSLLRTSQKRLQVVYMTLSKPRRACWSGPKRPTLCLNPRHKEYSVDLKNAFVIKLAAGA